MPDISTFTGLITPPLPRRAETSPAWQAAKELEVTFLSHMLKSAGFGDARHTFGGGSGEAQFTSFLREAQARQMVAAGGIGLAESFFNALKEHNDVR